MFTFSDQTERERHGKSIEDQQLPEDPKQRSQILLHKVIETAVRFFSGRTLEVQIPKISPVGVAKLIEEGKLLI